MTWTKATPKADGHYWWRRALGYVGEVVRIEGGIVFSAYRQLGGFLDSADRCGGEWCGPIEEPGGDAIENCTSEAPHDQARL